MLFLVELDGGTDYKCLVPWIRWETDYTCRAHLESRGETIFIFLLERLGMAFSHVSRGVSLIAFWKAVEHGGRGKGKARARRNASVGLRVR